MISVAPSGSEIPASPPDVVEATPPFNVSVFPLEMYRTAVVLGFTAYALKPAPACTLMSWSTMYTVPSSSVCLPPGSVTDFLNPASAVNETRTANDNEASATALAEKSLRNLTVLSILPFPSTLQPFNLSTFQPFNFSTFYKLFALPISVLLTDLSTLDTMSYA